MWSKWFGRKKNVPAEAVMQDLPEITLEVAILSDLGMIRTNNEDTGLFFRTADEAIRRRKGYLLVVADGMGGHQAGEVASALAAQTVSDEYFHTPDSTITSSLEKSFRVANERIYLKSTSDAAFHGMGTTCTAMVIAGEEIFYAHAGDSRAYHISNGAIRQVTQDHTYVQELVNAGEISQAEAAVHPKRNILTNAMGTKPVLRVDAGRHPDRLGDGDVVLLCSDGLYDYLSDEELLSMLDNRTLAQAAKEMVDTAKQRGGHDNITVVMAQRTDSAVSMHARETRDIGVHTDVPQTQETQLP
jgi:PPM family protein phosphatase